MSLFRNRSVLGILCIILSLVICFAAAPLYNKSITKTTEIVKLKSDIKKGEMVTEDKLETVKVGGYGLSDSIIRQKETAAGKYAAYDLAAGEYLIQNKISDEPMQENEYLSNLGEKQAISMTLKSFANGLSGKLQSGDIVSVIAADYQEQGLTVIPAELRYVEVISVTASSGTDANTGTTSKDDEEKELPSTVTLLVNKEQSLVIAELEKEGKAHLSLVYRGDAENRKVFLEAQEKVIKELYEDEEGQGEGESSKEALKTAETEE